jgi:hypothetical protein
MKIPQHTPKTEDKKFLIKVIGYCCLDNFLNGFLSKKQHSYTSESGRQEEKEEQSI